MPKSKLGSVLTVFGAAALAGVALLAMVLPSPREVTMKFWAGIPGALPPATDPTRPVARLPAVVTMAQAALADIEHDGAIRPPRPEEAERFIDAASARYRSKLSPRLPASVALRLCGYAPAGIAVRPGYDELPGA